MPKPLTIEPLSHAHLSRHMANYLAVSADVSPWTPEHFLKELPGKWDLSFALWRERPVGYCIMSRREGGVHIHQFMVAPAERRRGVGAAMIVEAKARASRAARRLTLKISRTNRAGLRFYERHGFALDGEEGGYLRLAARLDDV
jgi:ribosomal-protein-alanine N-acetyltransferase